MGVAKLYVEGSHFAQFSTGKCMSLRMSLCISRLIELDGHCCAGFYFRESGLMHSDRWLLAGPSHIGDGGGDLLIARRQAVLVACADVTHRLW